VPLQSENNKQHTDEKQIRKKRAHPQANPVDKCCVHYSHDLLKYSCTHEQQAGTLRQLKEIEC